MKDVSEKCFLCEKHTTNTPKHIIDGNHQKKWVRFCDKCTQSEKEFAEYLKEHKKTHP